MASKNKKKCLEFSTANCDPSGIANNSTNFSDAYNSLGEYENDIDSCKKRLEMSTAIGDQSEIASNNGDLGSAYLSLGEYEKAIGYYKISLEICTEIGDRSGIEKSSRGLGMVYKCLGEYQKAIGYYKISLEISTAIGYQSGIAYSTHGLGDVSKFLGEYVQAIDYYKRSLEISTAIGNRSGTANSNVGLGTVYQRLGEYEKAIDYYKISLEISTAIGDPSGIANSNCSLGSAYVYLGEYEKAIGYCKISLEISTAIDEKSTIAKNNHSLGNAYFSLGEYEKAFGYYKISLEISTAIGNRSGIPANIGGLANASLRLGEYEKATDYYKQSLEMGTAIGDKSGIATDNANLGNAYNHLGEYEDAAVCLMKSISLFDTLFLKSVPDKNKLSFTKQYFTVHQILTSCFISLERIESGLLVVDLGRAKVLHFSIERRQGSFDTMFDYARRMWEKIENEEEQLEIESIQKILQVENNAASVLVFAFDFENVLNVWVLNGEVIFRECKSDARLETFVRLISMFFRRVNVNVNRDSSFVKLDSVSNPDSQSIFSLEMPRKRSEATNLVEKTTDGDNLNNETILKKLYQLLIEPFRDVIKGNKLIVVPDKQLFFVPFSALIDENSCRLSRSYNIQITPSLHTLKCSIERSHDSDFGFALLVGNPTVGKISLNGKIFTPSDLPGATEEVKCLSKRFEAHPFLGREATKQIVLKHLSRATIIHIAAHGEPKRGEIILATQPSSSVPEPESYLLTQLDILSTSLKARLVVLCCCHTGQGEISSEGVIGIARAFLAAGARSVLATLWPIDDYATKVFMDAFYDELFQETSVCEALSRAKNRFQKYDPIKIWAPFTIYGEDVMFQKHDIEKIREKSREIFSDFGVLP